MTERVTEPGPLADPEIDLALACLFVHATAEREAVLVRAASAVRDWDALLAALERHGVLGLAARNLGAAGVGLPDGVAARLAERAAALREDALRFRFTLQRLVRELNRRDVVPILLKGASLGLDAYPDPALRGQGDLDVLVAPAELERALEAGAGAGLLPGLSSLPTWWYRRAHFHRKLEPSSALLREVEVHWALQHPSLLLTPDRAGLEARAPEREVGGGRVRVLADTDRLLHLVTHLVSHARGATGEPDAATLRAVLAETGHPLRLKWIVDVRVELERLGRALPLEELGRRAREWGAEGALAWVVRWVRSALPLVPEADEPASQLVLALGASAPARSGGGATRARALTALDFREEALALLPRWVLPPREYLERRYGSAGPLRRLGHAAGVLGRTALGAGTLPLAFVGRSMQRGRRERAFRASAAPEAVLELATDWRRLTRAPRAAGSDRG